MSNATQQREEIPRSSWQEALDLLTEEHEGNQVTIELVDEELGVQEEAEKLPLNYVGYDRKDDVVVVAVGGHSTHFPVVLRHMIRSPQTVWVHPPAPATTRALWVADSEGVEHLIRLHPLPELPD